MRSWFRRLVLLVVVGFLLGVGCAKKKADNEERPIPSYPPSKVGPGSKGNADGPVISPK